MDLDHLQEFFEYGSVNCIDRILELRRDYSPTITHITSQELKLNPGITRAIDANLRKNSERNWPQRGLLDGMEYLAKVDEAKSGKKIATIEILHFTSDECFDYYRYFLIG
jgi:hypothetical protein